MKVERSQSDRKHVTLSIALLVVAVLLILIPVVLSFHAMPNPDQLKDVAISGDPFDTSLPGISDQTLDSLAKIQTPPGFDWRKYEGITLNFIVENNLNANILTKESSNFTAITGINVNIRPMDYNTMVEKISLDLVSQRGKYQLLYIDPYQTLNRFSDKLYDLNQLNQNPELPHLPGGLSDFFPDQLDVVSYFRNREKLLAIPFDTTTMILFYRKDIFEKYGNQFKAQMGYDWTPGSPDFTWERYIEISKWIEKNVPKSIVRYGSGQMAQAHNSIYCEFSNVLAAYGGDYFTDSNVSMLGINEPMMPTMNQQAFVNALDVYKRVVQAAAPESRNWNWDDLAKAFMTSDIAMMPNWDENQAAVENPDISEVSGKVGYSVLPFGPVRSANIYGGSGIGINPAASQKEKEAAWLFIIWATSPRTELMVFLDPQGGNVPPRQSLNNQAVLAKIVAEAKNGGAVEDLIPQLSAVVSAWGRDFVYYRPKIKNFSTIEPIIINNLHMMIQENLEPGVTAEIMIEQIRQSR